MSNDQEIESTKALFQPNELRAKNWVRPAFPEVDAPPGHELRWARYQVMEGDELDIENLKQYIEDGWQPVPADCYPLTEVERAFYVKKNVIMGRGLILVIRSTLPGAPLQKLRQAMITHWAQYPGLPHL